MPDDPYGAPTPNDALNPDEIHSVVAGFDASHIITTQEYRDKRRNDIVQNIHQQELQIPRDRIELCLMRNLQRMRSGWEKSLGWLAIVIALLVTLETVDRFHAWLGVDPPTWKAIYLVAFVIAVVYTLVSAHKAMRSPSRDQVVRDILDELYLVEHQRRMRLWNRVLDWMKA